MEQFKQTLKLFEAEEVTDGKVESDHARDHPSNFSKVLAEKISRSMRKGIRERSPDAGNASEELVNCTERPAERKRKDVRTRDAWARALEHDD